MLELAPSFYRETLGLSTVIYFIIDLLIIQYINNTISSVILASLHVPDDIITIAYN